MNILKLIFNFFPLYRSINETKYNQTPIKFKYWFYQKILRINSGIAWPVHFSSTIICPENIELGVDTNPGYMPSCYIQAAGRIKIGDYTQIAANVGIVTSNHNPHQNRLHLDPKPVNIGKYCWIGFGAVILPGVTLGDFTVVGANSVVTKSFPNGYVILGGNPAKVIKEIDQSKCIKFKNEFEYIGYTHERNK